MNIQVTAIIPAYNAEAYIEKCIQSVIDQTVSCKAIIVDDHSTDRTYEIAAHYAGRYPDQILVLQNEMNMGVAASRNRAVKCADTEYIAFLDADDWWRADKTELQLQKRKEMGADACYSGRKLMNMDGSETGIDVRVPDEIDYNGLLKGNIIPCSTVLLKREDALAYPMEHDELHEDYIVWLSMLRDKKSFVGVNESLLMSRLGEQGKSRNKLKSAMMTYKVYRLLGLPTWKAAYCFCCYAAAGVHKYAGKSGHNRTLRNVQAKKK